MIVYIGFAQRHERPDWAASYARHATRFEDASGDRCIVVPYDMADRALLEALAPTAVVMSGFASSFETYAPGAFMPIADWLLNGIPVPTLAVCGSHQLVGFMFGGGYGEDTVLRDAPMRPRRPGEPITNPDYHPEYFMENGFYELRVLVPDPIFQHCGRPPMVRESHYCEVKHVPAGFNLLASTEECRIQAMRHEDLPLVSVQFHPEDYTERFPDGKFILEAFIREAVHYGLHHRRGVH